MTKEVEIREPLLLRIGDLADRKGVRAYVVGGYVRDLLRGSSVKDLDVVVLGSGIEFARSAASELGRTNLVIYEKFGTAMLQLDDWKIEFVGARNESYSSHSRKPAVQGGTLEDDLARRDFTINALAVSLNRQDCGLLIDPFGGYDDLQEGILRTPLNPVETFSDDPLRIMRAMRFASQLEFRVLPEVLDAAAFMAKRLSIVSQERITDEFMKIMASPRPSVGLELMFDAGVLELVFPEVAQLAGVDQRKDYHHKDVFRHTLKVLDNVAEQSSNLWLRMAALLHDIAKPRTKAFHESIGWTFHGHEELGARMVKPIFRRMKLPMEHIPYVEALVRLHLRPMALVDDEVTDSAVRRLMFDAGEYIDDLMLLCRADITSKNPRLVQQVKRNYDRVIEKMQLVEEKDRLRNWQPPVRGDEIMEVFGLEPGPAVGKLKQAVTDAVLDGKIPYDHDAALAYLHSVKEKILGEPANTAAKQS